MLGRAPQLRQLVVRRRRLRRQVQEAVLPQRGENRVDQMLVVEALAQRADADRLARQRGDEVRQAHARRHRHADFEMAVAEQSMFGNLDAQHFDRRIEHDERLVGQRVHS